MKFTLYGTDCCQLCDDALVVVEQALNGRDYQLEIIDISLFDELMTQYAYSIPVLQLNCVDLKWPFSVVDVHTLLINSGSCKALRLSAETGS